MVDLVAAWDRAACGAAAGRGLALLAGLQPESDAGALARLPVGVRDARLLRLRQELFGDLLVCLTRCPRCSTDLEFRLTASSLLEQEGGAEAGGHWLESDGHRISYRLPDSTDLAALGSSGAAGQDVARVLLTRCVLEARGPHGVIGAHEVPQPVVERLSEEMERRDPLAAVWLDFECDACGHGWQDLLDVASLLWAEIDRHVASLLRDVHALASAYGWTESEVLRLSAARRRRYLEMIGA